MNFPFALTGLSLPDEQGLSLLAPPTTSGSGSVSAPASSPNVFGKVTGKIGSAAGKVYDAVAGNSFLGTLFGSDYQYLTGIIGLLLIVAGIFLLRPVRETVVTVGKTAAKAAAVAA